jgi:hypothetical protein
MDCFVASLLAMTGYCANCALNYATRSIFDLAIQMCAVQKWHTS